MNKILIITFASLLSLVSIAGEKPIQHLKVADITSMQDAKEVFLATTADIQSKKTLNAQSAHEIHMITYSLEKSIAYFAETLIGNKKEIVENMAVIVEEIHLNSENNRFAKLKKYLATYNKLVDKFLFDFAPSDLKTLTESEIKALTESIGNKSSAEND